MLDDYGLSTPVIRRPGRLSGYQYIENAPALGGPHDILSMWARVARIAPRDLRGYNENTIVTAGVSISDEVWWYGAKGWGEPEEDQEHLSKKGHGGRQSIDSGLLTDTGRESSKRGGSWSRSRD